MALGVSIQAGLLYESGTMVAGLSVFLAVLLHKPLDAYSIIGMMNATGCSSRTRFLANIGFALLCPLITALTFWFVVIFNALQLEALIGYALAFAAGPFFAVISSEL